MKEGLKLDFKREYHLDKSCPPSGANPQEWRRYVDGQWDELVKDIISLTNGNVGTPNKVGRLIIGVADKLNKDGSRDLCDTTDLGITAQQVMAKVNSACVPAIPDVLLEKVDLEGKLVTVITIPPSPYLHESTRDLEVTRGNFDNQGKLTKVDKKKSYTRHTAFIRKGEDILPASNFERRALEEDKKFGLLAMKQNLKLEVIDNLKLLLLKSGKSGEIVDLSAFIHVFTEKYCIKSGETLVIERGDFSLIAYPLMQASRARSGLSTQFLDSAILSGKYLTFDAATGQYFASEFLEGLLKLQERIRRLKLVASEIASFFGKYAPARNPEPFIHISSNDSIFIGGILNLYQDVTNLCSALLSYLFGDLSPLRNLVLTNVTPDDEQAEGIKREALSEEEVIQWLKKRR